MKGRSFSKATALLAGVAIIAAAGVASAQVGKDDAKCRSTIFKTQSKLAATVGKAIAGCWKDVLKGKAAASTNCNDLSQVGSKGLGKIAKAEAKVIASVGGAKTKCDDTTHAASLAMFPSCPSPGNATDDGPPTAGIDSFSELGACEVELAKDMVATYSSYILQPNVTEILNLIGDPDKANQTIGKTLSKCVQTISKNAIKLHATVAKVRGKCQATSDKGGGAFTYGCSTNDTGGKIAAAVAKLNAGIDKACTLKKTGPFTGPQLALAGACDTTTAGIKNCVATAATKNSSGLTALAFENAQVCPTLVKLVSNAGTGGNGVLTATRLDAGYTGLGHNVDLLDGFEGAVNLDCSASADCDQCSVTVNCSTGSCRCSNDVAIACSIPFAADPACGGNVCDVFFGPPLALSAGGTGTCVVNQIPSELVGSADVGTGSSLTTVKSTATVFLPESATQPCPVCDTGGTPSLGDSGTCLGGARNGLSCTVNAIHPTFGASSYDCPPTALKNISGGGLKLTLTLTDGAVSLGAGLNCDVGGPSCPCAVCSNDATLPCTSDSDCVFPGTCTSNGGGATRLPNSCGSFGNCADVGGGDGECSDASNNFCDGFVRASGKGVMACNDNADCGAGVGGGTCSINEPTPCFLDPIDAQGQGGQDGAVLVSTFCTPPTNNPGVNIASGSPGPGRIKIDFDFDGLCSDGITPWELGGANCP